MMLKPAFFSFQNIVLAVLLLTTIGVGVIANADAKKDDAKVEAALRKIFLASVYLRPTAIPYREENPYTAEKEELGRLLFFDQRLSKSGNQSCVSCHHPGLGWEMGLSKAMGAQEMPRKSSTLLNLAWNDSWFWDGRADGYAQQFHMALLSPKALAMTTAEAEARLRAVPGYLPYFQRAFGAGKSANELITEESMGKALEIFQRGLVSGPSAFDKWLNADSSALSLEAKQGALIFAGKGNCIACHSGWNFSDQGFHDVGLVDPDIGRGKSLVMESMQHAFKTPTLRSIAQRKPYMHDGSLATLEDVVDHYNEPPTVQRTSLAPEMHALHLSSAEKRSLVEFLKSLTGEDQPVAFPRVPM